MLGTVPNSVTKVRIAVLLETSKNKTTVIIFQLIYFHSLFNQTVSSSYRITVFNFRIFGEEQVC